MSNEVVLNSYQSVKDVKKRGESPTTSEGGHSNTKSTKTSHFKVIPLSFERLKLQNFVFITEKYILNGYLRF